MNIFTTSSFVDVLNVTFNNHSPVTLPTSQDTNTSVMPLWIRILTLSCMILIDICAFFGNLLVICAFFRTRRLQTVTNYFIASLAFADALVAIFVLPLGIYYYQRNRSWKLGLILCDLWVSSDVLLCTSSILNLTCISVDRYMAITRPLTYTAYRSKFLARVMILLVWIVSVVITCPPIFGWRDSNRRQTVEKEHKCELNTARGYVVYSALGSFYIPAVIMIFVYIRIFMVVYDRESLIKKFQDNTNQSSVQLPLKSHQNGSAIHRNFSEGKNSSLNDSNQSKSCYSCLCLSKCLSRTSGKFSPHRSSSFQNQCSTLEDKIDGKISSSPNSVLPSETKKSISAIFCRPRALSLKKTTNLEKELSQYRRNYLSCRAAEYQFRTGESPCYERKKVLNPLLSVRKGRSFSLEQISSHQTCDELSESDHQRVLSTGTTVKSVQSHDQLLCSLKDKIDDLISSNQENLNSWKKALHQPFNNDSSNLEGLSDDIVPLAMLEQTKSDELEQSHCFTKRSPTILTYSSSINEQSFPHSATYSTLHEQSSLSERNRVNQRKKSLHAQKSTPSSILLENFKQQYKVPLPHSSLKSNHSLASIRRFNEPTSSSNPSRQQISSKFCCCCSSCLAPLNRWYEKKNQTTLNYTPNHSLTNDDEDEDKVSSNDISNRLPLMVPSNSSLRALDSHNHATVGSSILSSLHQFSAGVHSNNSSNDVHRRERIRFLKEQKTAKTLAVVVGGFVLFWLPFFIMYIIPPEVYLFNPQTVVLITWLGYCNSVINPFIYAYCSKQFRMAFWNITFGLCVKKSNVFLPISAKPNPIQRRDHNTSVH